MWIEEYHTNAGKRYRFCERYEDPLTGKLKKVSVSKTNQSRATKKAAFEELQIKITKAINRQNTDAELITLIEEFIESKIGFRRQSTIDSYHSELQKIKEFFPVGTQVMRITVAHLQAMVDTLVRQYTTSEYARNVLSLMRRSLERANRLEKLPDAALSPLAKVVVPQKVKSREQIQKARDKYLTADELKEVLSAIRTIHPRSADVFEFQALTGLRFGEVVALRKEDYDATSHAIHITGSITFKHGWTRGEPKNEYSYRTVLLDERAEQILKSFLDNAIRCQLWQPRKRKNHDGELYIFSTDSGRPIDLRDMNRRLAKAEKLCVKCKKHLSTHIFRHTHISFLAQANIPLKTVMDRVGHESPRTTLQVYTHVTEEMKQQGVNAIASIARSLHNA